MRRISIWVLLLFVGLSFGESAQSFGLVFQDDLPKKQAEAKKQSPPKNQNAKPKNQGKGPAFTEPPKDDLCYGLMGEFLGRIDDGNGEKTLGLQIRVLGEDQFDAIAYHGGLPGQPKFSPEPIRMIGRRSDEFMILSGGPWVVIVEQKICRVVNRKGKQIGQLKRIKRTSPTMHAPVPEGGLVLFDGSSVEHFTNGKMTPGGLLIEGADLKPMFHDFNLHVEFRLPYMPIADEQKRANSGLYLQSRYECQILDSFATTPVINGAGALYRFRKPDLNMCLPPLVWQTYDVQFTAPRWSSGGTKIRNAVITSWLNGVKVQDNISLPNKTGAGKPEEPILLPIRIQNHGDPVRFRNIWVVDRGLVSNDFPVKTTKKDRALANKEYQKRAKELRKLQAKDRRKKKASKDTEKAGDLKAGQDK